MKARQVGRVVASAAVLAALLGAAAFAERKPASSRIEPAALRAHVRFLADDLLEGREAGARGHDLAARYVAAQFEARGLEPGGTDGTYFQSVPLRRSKLAAEGSKLTLAARGAAERTLQANKDYVAAPHSFREDVEVGGPVVYAGFGIQAPGRKHDDYAKVDVRGKVVALLLGAPPSFPNDERAFYSSRLLKLETAAAKGASGVLFLLSPEEEQRFPFPRIVEMLEGGVMTWVDRDGLAHGAVASLSGTAILSRAGAEALFAGSPKALDQAFKDAAAGKTASYALPVEARLRTKSQNQALTSPNVIGLLRGSDPLLAPEQVVFSAHLDHLGIGTPREGDAIYNGALDNASGVAALVEIAGAFAAQPKPPKRSILFAAVTAEEEGLLGAEYLANNPTVPGAVLVANFNIDMFLSLYPLKDLIAFGGEHSSLGKLAAETAGRVGIELSPDPFPEEVIFIRSDHFPFVQKGIPAVMLCSGLRSADPKVEGKTVVGRWLATTYHSPKDDAAQPLDYDAAARIAEIYYLMASRVADDPARPTWNKGDFFGDRFGKR